MSFTRSRTQVLYRHVPGAVFEHDRYGISRVTDVAVSAPSRLNEEALQTALRALLDQWQGSGDDAFPDPVTEWEEYSPGTPNRVDFEPFPTVVECRACGHINFLDTLAQLSGEPRCTSCHQERYRQLPYLMIHACGRMSPIFVPRCPTHGHSNVRFHDTGRFVTAWWSCASCGDATISRMSQVPCGCAYGRQTGDGNMRYVRTNDTSVLYSHTVPFVNLQEGVLERLRDDPRSTGLLLARAWGLLEEKACDLAARRATAAASVGMNDQAQALVRQLLRDNPESEAARKLAAMYGNADRLPGEETIDRVAGLIGAVVDVQPSRSLLEYVAILDTLDILTPEMAATNAHERGDAAGAYDVEAAVRFAHDMLGIGSMSCITNFPLALASVAYSRVGNRPGEALVRPIRPLRREGGKVPVYVVTSDTEAVLVQLDPNRVAQWLIANDLEAGPTPDPGAESWAWCRRNLPGLSSRQGLLTTPDTLSAGERAVLTLLHSASHLLLGRVEWSGFDPESVGEYILPDSLAVIIHSNNYSSFTIGGMVTMFEQRLLGWLQDAYNAAFTCTYNPICQDEGASCAGCLHRQHNCEAFNDLLSRSTLSGGIANGLPEITVGYWAMSG